MSGDPGNRRLLPQSSQMQSFSFAPNNYGQRENQKSAPYLPLLADCFYTDCDPDYVFVDEHNRHKRLKGSHPQSPESYEQDQYGQQNLADLLGELRMDEAGTELMPDESTILHYFDMYFANVHPDAISPLILEAIFAIAGRLADEPAQGHQWLALASKHADSFMDVPRLSTLQATLIVLKARESSPKRGYYYRSWMTVVQCVQMAKDLGLDEHYEEHKAGRPCGSDLADCITKTRIWQTIFVCELMIGSPQAF
ncbi:hypothetical protein M7I_6170 [Glarea lozoyensis 74030]|uniref:Transcription factor domain-containing protein n=1 Tax=Glarea lozoyensis (strain ATCC 74030 / MF5533) TaxID=1104152 RepID=H0ETU9_GLAL7|nr:hypothetical protein M7I_6170 [Glarea lozoyensis 74030]